MSFEGTSALPKGRRETVSAFCEDGKVGDPWLICRTGLIRSALPIASVFEVMRVLPLGHLAGAPVYVRGVSMIRGTAVPVVDLRWLLAGEAAVATRLITVRTGERIVALAVEEVRGIASIGAATLHRLPPLLQNAAKEAVTAIGAIDSELLVCLDAGRLVPDELAASLETRESVS